MKQDGPSGTPDESVAHRPSAWSSFIVGLGYFTRLPCTHLVEYSPEALNRSSLFLWLYGVLIGGISGLSLLTFHSVGVPTSQSVLLSMVTSLLLTGAFHEDGLADSCDGFGGGWNTHSVLTIMKDSRLGTYGAIGVFVALCFKWQSLLHLAEASIFSAVLSLILAHSVSRSLLALTMYRLLYVREDLESKAKPIAQGIPLNAVVINVVLMVTATLFLCGIQGIVVAATLIVIQQISSRYFFMRLGGYTGDCLGAQQQILELASYLLVMVILC
jgi:adenosylcobinamide-GDP ribazoletransferase